MVVEQSDLLIGVPLGASGCPAETFGNFCAVAQGYDVFTHIGRNDVNRNAIAKHALEHGYRYCLQLDADHLHPADIAERLKAHMIADPNKRVVAALTFRRTMPVDPLAWNRGTDGKWHNIHDWQCCLLRVGRVGMGAMLIQTNVFEQMPEPWFRYGYPAVGEYPGPDLWFCDRCAEHSIAIYVDTETVSPHLGAQAWIDEETYRRAALMRRVRRA